MKFFLRFTYILLTAWAFALSTITGGCAQIGLPTGGEKDSLAPKLVKATPAYGSLNVKNNKITLEFNEYIDVQELQQNLIISPLQSKNPTITSNPRSVTIKFKDSLLPNTTYTVNFGDAIKDVNEGNVYKNLSYTFSTGSVLDSLTIAGKIIMAETGNVDSTLLIMLYRNAVDSTVTKKKPNYVAKLDGEGNFEFRNLPNDNFKIYGLKDGDGGKTYNAPTEVFAFADKDINSLKNEALILYASAEKKEEAAAPSSPVRNNSKAAADKKLKLTTSLQGAQDLFEPIELRFNNALKFIDSTKIYITDTSYKRLKGVKFSKDSTAKKIILDSKWQAGASLVLIIDTLFVSDSAGLKLAKNDTIRFTTKRVEDYGKLTLRFNGLDLKRKPVLQFLVNDVVKNSYALTSNEWNNNMFAPGEYGIRILFDTNNDGKWTAGNYKTKLQPETAITLPQKLNVKADWENERDINL
jgi:Bacterial Ig-like domain